jgi:hypothetical protein
MALGHSEFFSFFPKKRYFPLETSTQESLLDPKAF